MKIVFFGTSNFALPILEALNSNHQVVGVVTTPDAKAGRSQEFAESPVSALARDLKLNVHKPESLKGNAQEVSDLQNLGADLFIVAAYGKIISSEILGLPSHKSINVHPSLLPKYRGASPIQYALLNGDDRTGVSIMLMDEEVDHGPLLAQQSVPIDSDDSFFTLSDKLAHTAAKLLINALAGYLDGSLKPQTQDDSQASFTKIIERQDGKVDWNKSAREIYNQFRAFYPWPGIWTTWNGKILKITDCLPAQYPAINALPGTVQEGGVMACGGGTYLQINSLQLEGRNETGILDFLNGYRDFVGSKLT